MSVRQLLTRHQRDLLLNSLKFVFGEFDQAMLEHLMPRLEWVELSGGEDLFAQGDEACDLYFVLSGRLRAHALGADGQVRQLGEIMRGETVGEMAVIANEPRSASITAIRDSVLVRLTRAVFEDVLRAYPHVAMNITRLVIDRLKRAGRAGAPSQRPVNVCIAPITRGVFAEDFAGQLVALLKRYGKAALVSSALVNEDNDLTVAQATKQTRERYHILTEWLDEMESRHEFLVFLADPYGSEWTKRCVRHADTVLLLADATQEPAVHPIEVEALGSINDVAGARQHLVLLHPNEARLPRHTAAWLARRPVHGHFHLRRHHGEDMARLVRILTGRAVGLVFSGGGARGFAHLGVYKAMAEAGIPVDFVGGTSIGSVMGAYAAFGLPPEELIALARKAFAENPTSDINVVPLVSLIGGRKLRQVIDGAIEKAVGFQPDIEDTWKTYFCVASNFSTASEFVARRGPLAKMVRASVSIPGALPPVMHEGEMLLDGGTFNNFPVDIMVRSQQDNGGLGAAKVVGVDLVKDKHRKQGFDEVPGTLALLRDRFRSHKDRRYKLPSPVATLLQFSILTSVAKGKDAREATDLFFNPDLGRVGMLEWRAFDRIVQIGYDHAKEVMGKLSPQALASLRGDVPDAKDLRDEEVRVAA
jgi:NTE family protein